MKLTRKMTKHVGRSFSTKRRHFAVASIVLLIALIALAVKWYGSISADVVTITNTATVQYCSEGDSANVCNPGSNIYSGTASSNTVSTSIDNNTTAPTVSLSSPNPYQTYNAPATVVLGATVSTGVTRVEFFRSVINLDNDNSPADQISLNVDTSAPFSFSWANVPANNSAGNYYYVLTARATNSSGSTTSAPVYIKVNGQANTAPTVSLTDPAQSFRAPANIALQATASDPGGSVTKVEFFKEGQASPLGSDTTGPDYVFNWNNVPAGTHRITAKATDNGNLSTTSAPPVSIVVDPANQTPTAALELPANNASYTAPVDIQLRATANDPDGNAIQKVSFYMDKTGDTAGALVIYNDTQAPYEYTWPRSASQTGTYTFTAKAFDASGLAGAASNARTVTVNSPPPATSACLIIKRFENLTPITLASSVKIYEVGQATPLVNKTTVTPDGTGRITITDAALTQQKIDTLRFDILVKPTGFLTRKYTNKSLASCVDTTQAEALIPGDFKNDNVINGLDFPYILGGYKNSTNPEYQMVKNVYGGSVSVNNLNNFQYSFRRTPQGDTR